MIEKDEYLQQSVIGDTLKMTFGYRRKHTLKKMKKADGMVSMIKKSLQKDWQLYLLVLPTLIYVIIFNYIPMYGLRIAFEDIMGRGNYMMNQVDYFMKESLFAEK